MSSAVSEQSFSPLLLAINILLLRLYYTPCCCLVLTICPLLLSEHRTSQISGLPLWEITPSPSWPKSTSCNFQYLINGLKGMYQFLTSGFQSLHCCGLNLHFLNKWADTNSITNEMIKKRALG